MERYGLLQRYQINWQLYCKYNQLKIYTTKITSRKKINPRLFYCKYRKLENDQRCKCHKTSRNKKYYLVLMEIIKNVKRNKWTPARESFGITKIMNALTMKSSWWTPNVHPRFKENKRKRNYLKPKIEKGYVLYKPSRTEWKQVIKNPSKNNEMSWTYTQKTKGP